MIEQQTLPFSRVMPAIRKRDPETSCEAAVKAQKKASLTQYEIVAVLRVYGPMTDEQIAAKFAFAVSPSGLRSRRAELVALGMVRWSGTFGKTASGGKCRIWEATPQ